MRRLVDEQVDDLPEEIAVGQRPWQPAAAGQPRLERLVALGRGFVQFGGAGTFRFLALPPLRVQTCPPLLLFLLPPPGLLGR
jgi:hypothetical protein